ncbi:hypothetical protein MHC_03560 [Mycoplasma haemocanis str. Illinois]|uniref:Uncharacterized protein n=1 Tax=Mycoplasma haemocanis (strain Illinois) TaxID=1111676 RepID=H6N7F0_MYCHN|nr:hypothetical protein [Mycoplasma haemocanis]AEW45572.1 hypothetical protein MHC_03560 [Mycoplasma haemocanis str. Illinois]
MSKIAIASLAGLGAAGASGFGIYNFYFKSSKNRIISIRDRLVSEGFKLLTSSDKSHWTELKGAYNNKKSDNDKVFKKSREDIDEETLKTLCAEVLEKEENDLSYSKAKKWCVVPVSVTEHLSNLKLNLLSTTGDGNKSEWEKVVTEYEKDVNPGKRISDLSTLSDQKWEKIRDKCKDLSSKKSYEDDFDTSLESSKRWCVANFIGKVA